MIAVVFLPIFIALLAVPVIAVAFLILKRSRSRNMSLPNPPPPSEMQQRVIREEVVKKEIIVKVRCSYCHAQFDETLDKCPNCGAAH